MCIRTCKRIKKRSSHLKLSPFLPVKFPIWVTVFFTIWELPVRILEVNITLYKYGFSKDFPVLCWLNHLYHLIFCTLYLERKHIFTGNDLQMFAFNRNMGKYTEAYLEHSQISKMERFVKIVNVHKMLHLRCLAGIWLRLWLRNRKALNYELFHAMLYANMLLKCKKVLLLGYAFSVSIFTYWSRSGRVCSWCSPKYKLHHRTYL